VVNVDVVNQYKDHTLKNPTSMSVQKPVTQRRSLIIARRLSIRPETHIRKTTAMLADRNGKLDNFARTARAGEDHKMQLRNTSGFFNQRLNVKRAAKKLAAQAISVVAKPACARIGGNAARRTVANRAAVSPKSCRPNNHTSATARRKNGRIPT
jgi:hypothetical protein